MKKRLSSITNCQGNPRIILIGCGYWGKNLARNLSSLGVLHSVVDCNKDNAERFSNEFGVNYYTDYKTAFGDISNIKQVGVVIATPPNTHFTIAKYFLDKGVATFVEKPITLSSEDAVALNGIAIASNTTLMVGHVFLYCNEVRYIKEYITKGRLGSIYSMTTRRLNLGIIQPHCNVVWDLAPHDISVFNYLLGEEGPLKIDGTVTSVLGVNGNEEDAFLSLTYSNNVVCNMHLSWLYPKKIRDMVIVGSEGMIVYDMLGENKLCIYDKSVALDSVDAKAATNYGSHLLSYRYGDMVAPYIAIDEPLRAELVEFITAVKTGIDVISSGDVGVNVVKVLERIDRLQGVR
jgi:predicted dehydrogenase